MQSIEAKETTAIITPANFGFDHWTPGTLRHVIKALDGSPVVVTIDGSGHTRINVTLAFNEATGQVEITDKHGTLRYDASWIGDTIVPLIASEAKWKAVDSYRGESKVALELVRRELKEGEAGTWGTWSTVPQRNGVDVSYKPKTTNPHFSDRWGQPFSRRVELADLPAAALAAAGVRGE